LGAPFAAARGRLQTLKALGTDEARELNHDVLSCSRARMAADHAPPIQPIRKGTRQKRSSQAQPGRAKVPGCRCDSWEAADRHLSWVTISDAAFGKRLKGFLVTLTRVMPGDFSQHADGQVHFLPAITHGALMLIMPKRAPIPVPADGSAEINRPELADLEQAEWPGHLVMNTGATSSFIRRADILPHGPLVRQTFPMACPFESGEQSGSPDPANRSSQHRHQRSRYWRDVAFDQFQQRWDGRIAGCIPGREREFFLYWEAVDH